MPGQTISANGTTEIVLGTISDPVPLLVSGNNNIIFIYSQTLSATAGGPAILLTGTGNQLRLFGQTITTNGATAILGSDGRDEVINYTANIAGIIDLAGGDDYFFVTGNLAIGQVLGGSGDDVFSGLQATATVNFSGGDGIDYLNGGSAADVLDGGADSDFLNGYGGDDFLTGGAGADRLEGGIGNDTISGGGDEGDVLVFNNYRADTDVNLVGGVGTLTDNGGSFDDQGTDTVSGINIVRFRDQQVDFRITENLLVLDQTGQSFNNTVARYGFVAADLRAEGVTLTNASSIRGTGITHTVETTPGQFVEAMDAAVVVNAANVTINNQAGGSILGLGRAISATYPPPSGGSYPGSNLAITNAGSIRSLESSAISLVGSGMTVTNLAGGVIEGHYYGVVNPNAISTINNAGLIRGGGGAAFAAIRSGVGHIVNTGQIEGGFDLLYFASTVSNSGTISGNSRANGGMTLNNIAGSITGNLAIDVYGTIGQGSPSFTYFRFDNQAQFTGTITIRGTATSFVVDPAPGTVYTAEFTNSGTLTGSIMSNPVLGNGPGGLLQVSFADRVTNSGTITGNLMLGAGDDYLLNTGVINGIVDGEGGNDTLIGGNGIDIFYGGSGDDMLNGGEGDDLLDGGTGSDTLIGGNGTDALRVSASGPVTSISGFEALDFVGGATLTLTDAQFNGGLAQNTQVTGTGTLIVNMATAGTFVSKLFTFASTASLVVNGTSGSDIFKLGNASHTVNAGDGTDQIKGGNLVDVIDGGAGIDKINGAGGADILTGGGGNDVFRYTRASDSGVGPAADRITDYAIGGDRLNFKDIDADTSTAGDQAFAFVGTGAFSGGGAGSIRYQNSGADLLVQVDVNGDGVADMEIILQSRAGGTLTTGDFVL